LSVVAPCPQASAIKLFTHVIKGMLQLVHNLVVIRKSVANFVKRNLIVFILIQSLHKIFSKFLKISKLHLFFFSSFSGLALLAVLQFFTK
jgi:hypothetical protein